MTVTRPSTMPFLALIQGLPVLVMTSKAWHVSIGKSGASGKVTDHCRFLTRVHSDGQKRPVFIYRFLTAGTIDGV